MCTMRLPGSLAGMGSTKWRAIGCPLSKRSRHGKMSSVLHQLLSASSLTTFGDSFLRKVPPLRNQTRTYMTLPSCEFSTAANRSKHSLQRVEPIGRILFLRSLWHTLGSSRIVICICIGWKSIDVGTAIHLTTNGRL